MLLLLLLFPLLYTRVGKPREWLLSWWRVPGQCVGRRVETRGERIGSPPAALVVVEAREGELARRHGPRLLVLVSPRRQGMMGMAVVVVVVVGMMHRRRLRGGVRRVVLELLRWRGQPQRGLGGPRRHGRRVPRPGQLVHQSSRVLLRGLFVFRQGTRASCRVVTASSGTIGTGLARTWT